MPMHAIDLPASLTRALSTHSAPALCVLLASALRPQVGQAHYLCWLKNGTQDIVGVLPRWWAVALQGKHALNQIQIQTPNQFQSQFQNKGKSAAVTQTATRQLTTAPAALRTTKASSALSTQSRYTKHSLQADSLQSVVKDYIQHNQPAQATTHAKSASKHPAAPTFAGGLLGFVGYDLAAMQTANVVYEHPDARPSAYFGHYDVVWLRDAGGWGLYVDDSANAEANKLAQLLINLLIEALKHNQSTALEPLSLFRLTYQWDKSTYARAFEQVQDYLRAGDCYQVNLAQRLTASCTGEPISALAALEAKTAAPHAGFLQVDDFSLISCSPELFLAFENDAGCEATQQDSTISLSHAINTHDVSHTANAISTSKRIKVITKPIKGTLPRLGDPEADARQVDALSRSEKNRSENLMIVDLLRNDLSIHAETGSVRVPKLFEIESFAQVHHMVSTIEATLHRHTDTLDVLFDALPGGSITGAPKVRAIEIIAELEKHSRGAYCGSLGFINFDGTGSFNILIRSLEFWQGKLALWAGGGITIKSDCAEEYQECMDKISGIIRVLEDFCG